MNTQIKQKVNSFDTINLTIPGDVINRDARNYSYDLKVNEETDELMQDNYGDCKQYKFIRDKKNHLGLGHCIYVPHRNIYDISISAKILKNKYPIGITKETIYVVIQALENYGIGDIEEKAFVELGEIRTCDNTFNIPVDNFENQKSIYQTFDALSSISAFGLKQKMKTFDADGEEFGDINGVVFKKDTRSNQQITFYYKIDEAFSQRGDKREHHQEVIMRKYGMESNEFFSAFEKTIRAELRLTSQDLMKKSFNLQKGPRNNVVLKDILESKSNAMLKKFNEFVSQKQTEKGMLQIEKRRRIKNALFGRDNFEKPTKQEMALRLWANAIYDYIEMTDGNYKAICAYVNNEFYNGTGLNNSMYEKIQILCKLYQNRDKEDIELGVLVKRYKEINKKIKELV